MFNAVSELSFSYVGKIRGQGRPRFANRRAYKAKADVDYEQAIRAAYVKAYGRFKPHDGGVIVSIDVYRCLPKSAPKSVKSEPDVIKPDADNIAKAVLDALNGVAWIDDSQVVGLQVNKFPRRRDCVERMFITIQRL